jgi:hypothetical protein
MLLSALARGRNVMRIADHRADVVEIHSFPTDIFQQDDCQRAPAS